MPWTRPALCAAALVATAALAWPPAPAMAQDRAQEEEGFDAEDLKRRFDEAWDEMMRGIAPTIEGLGALLETLERIDSLENYERAEILPNGDIVIRRKPDAPPLPEMPEEHAPEEPERAPDEPASPDEPIKT